MSVLRDNFGLTIREHEHFDPVDPVHSPNSYHYHGEAIDVQDWRDDVIDGVGWKDRTSNLRNLLQGAGPEVLGPGDSGHDSHLHLAAKDGVFTLNQQQYDTLFGGNAGGRIMQHLLSLLLPSLRRRRPDGTPTGCRSDGPVIAHQTAATRAKEYSKMNKDRDELCLR